MIRFSTLALIVAVSASASAQVPIQVRLDAGTFRYTEDLTLVEVYLSIGAHTLPFQQTEDGFTAQVPVRVQLMPSATAAPDEASRTPIFDETLPLSYVIADTTALTSGQVFVEQVRLAAAPGEYELDVTMTPTGGSEVRLARDLRIPAYASGDQTKISSVQLASSIQASSDPSDPLSKSGLAIRPNPDAFYGGGQSVQYYAEVYAPPADGDDYTLLSFVAETDGGSALPGHQNRVQRASRPVDVVAGQMDVSTLPSGIYHLRLVVLNDANESVSEQSKRFYVINPDVERTVVAANEMSLEETLFASMGEEELELNVRHAAVIATNQEQAEIRAIQTDDDRRRFLAAFWSRRDTDSVTSVNEARRAFYQRLNFTEDRLREFGAAGFETDRGRVYLTYGPPTEIERRIFEADAYPHELWLYDNIPGEGRSVFVFVARFSNDQFDLLHSDVVGEVSIPNWEMEIIR